MYLCCYFRINKIRPKATASTEIHNKPMRIMRHVRRQAFICGQRCFSVAITSSHIRQFQFATHAFSQKALQQAVQIKGPPDKYMSMFGPCYVTLTNMSHNYMRHTRVFSSYVGNLSSLSGGKTNVYYLRINLDVIRIVYMFYMFT